MYLESTFVYYKLRISAKEICKHVVVYNKRFSRRPRNFVPKIYQVCYNKACLRTDMHAAYLMQFIRLVDIL